MSKSTFRENLSNVFLWYLKTTHDERKDFFRSQREKEKRAKKEKRLERYYKRHPEKRPKKNIIRISAEDGAKMDALVQKQAQAANELNEFLDNLSRGTPANRYLH